MRAGLETTAQSQGASQNDCQGTEANRERNAAKGIQYRAVTQLAGLTN